MEKISKLEKNISENENSIKILATRINGEIKELSNSFSKTQKIVEKLSVKINQIQISLIENKRDLMWIKGAFYLFSLTSATAIFGIVVTLLLRG